MGQTKNLSSKNRIKKTETTNITLQISRVNKFTELSLEKTTENQLITSHIETIILKAN